MDLDEALTFGMNALRESARRASVDSWDDPRLSREARFAFAETVGKMRLAALYLQNLRNETRAKNKDRLTTPPPCPSS